MKIAALVIFVVTYGLLLVLPKHRAYIAAAMGALMIIIGILPTEEIFYVIDWNVILMIAGTMGIVSLFIKSKMPALLADWLIIRTPNVKWAIIALSLFAGIISAFVDNVATVLMVAPIALTISKKLSISPVPSIVAIAISSNLQGAATLVGDTTSILLGGYAGLDFLDFFFFQGKFGMFWVVQAGAIVSTLVLLFVFRRDDQKISHKGLTKVEDYFPTVLLLGMIALLIVSSFIREKPAITSGLICVGLMLIGMVYDYIKFRSKESLKKTVCDIDYTTLLLLAGLFVVIGGITEVGIIEDISDLFVRLSGDNIFVIFSLLVWASVLLSAFIDNIPYIATMLPVTQAIAATMGVDPYLLYFGLLSGATLGGNLTPIGASANVTALGILRKEGYEVKTGEFMKISVPFTLAAVTTGYLLVWFIWR